MKTWILPLLLVLGAAGTIGLVRESATQARLRGQIAQARRDTNGADPLARERRRLVDREAEVRDLQDDEHELDRLRRQVFELKVRVQQIPVDASLANPGAPPPPLAPGMTPIDRFVESSPTTPGAAAENFFCAVAQADPDALARQLVLDDRARDLASAVLGALDPAVRDRMGSPERMMAVFFVGLLGRVSGVQLPSVDSDGSDRAGWQATVQTTSGRTASFGLAQVRTADGWREVVPISTVYTWERYLFANGNPPPPTQGP